MPKNKMITKSCPKCVQQLPVACKACPCGHSFFSARKAVIAAQEVRDEGPMKRRRTERVKREKPNYYDALQYEKQTKKKRNRTAIHGEHNRKGEPGDTQHRLKKKRKKKVTEEKEQDDKDVTLSLFTPENSLKCFVILAEINRKIGSTSWRV